MYKLVAIDLDGTLLNSNGEVSDGTHTAECSALINDYVDKVKEIQEWESTLAILNNLKVKFDEEVEVKEEVHIPAMSGLDQ